MSAAFHHCPDTLNDSLVFTAAFVLSLSLSLTRVCLSTQEFAFHRLLFPSFHILSVFRTPPTCPHTHTHARTSIQPLPIFSGVFHLFKSPQVTANIFSTHSLPFSSSSHLPFHSAFSSCIRLTSSPTPPPPPPNPNAFSGDTGLLMTSLRFVSQLALTAVDYLAISIRRQRHLRDSPALAVQRRCANTLVMSHADEC